MPYQPHTENRREEVLAIVNTASPEEAEAYCQELGPDDLVEDRRVDLLSNEIRALPQRDIHRAADIIECFSKSAAPESRRVAAYAIGPLVLAMQSEERLSDRTRNFVDRWAQFLADPDDDTRDLARLELVSAVDSGLRSEHIGAIMWALVEVLGEPWRRRPEGVE